MPEPKDRLTIRVDHDVVQWLKKNSIPTFLYLMQRSNESFKGYKGKISA
jgi:hypothetical protein